MKIARYVREYLKGEYSRLWKKYQREEGVANSYKEDFYIGLYTGLKEKLLKIEREEKMKNLSLSKQLIRVDNELSEYVSFMYPKLETRSENMGGRNNQEVQGAGRESGGNINIRKGVYSSHSERRLLK